MNILELFQRVRTFVFDMDGVLTDGGLWLMEDGQQVRRMNIRDGYALQLAIKMGYHVLVISGATSSAARLRLLKLGITEVHMGIEDKRALLKSYMETHNLDPVTVLYMGDDIPDLESMETIGLPCCPSDAATEILSLSKYISPLKGGEGCVRDVIEKVLKLNDHWAREVSVVSR